jgi:hypothetical protein
MSIDSGENKRDEGGRDDSRCLRKVVRGSCLG